VPATSYCARRNSPPDFLAAAAASG